LTIGPFVVDPPVVLAPMAGITNVAFRRLCRIYGAGLYVCEMITSRALVERDAATLHMITFDRDEHPRSVQLYGVDPRTMGDAVRMIVWPANVPARTATPQNCADTWRHSRGRSSVMTPSLLIGSPPCHTMSWWRSPSM
jgi:hypothetical protein